VLATSAAKLPSNRARFWVLGPPFLLGYSKSLSRIVCLIAGFFDCAAGGEVILFQKQIGAKVHRG
jgi:hypothetical protein